MSHSDIAPEHTDMKIHIIACAITATVLAVTLPAARAVSEASIPFANHGGIRDWRADGHRALYVQARNKQWYRAELVGYCQDLPQALSIAFVSEPTGDFDRYSSIVVRGQRCMLKALAESAPPPAKARTTALEDTQPQEQEAPEAQEPEETQEALQAPQMP
jgi:Family of unknown function (DUF6491)